MVLDRKNSYRMFLEDFLDFFCIIFQIIVILDNVE